jgi:hypothetical protein
MLDFLKTMPDLTNTPEITMQEDAPKISMSTRIREYKAANPHATAKEVADAVGTSTIYVYQILANPPKKAKTAKKTEPVLEKPIKNKQLEDAKDEIETLRLIIDVQKRQTEKHLAIIEYLEGKVGELNELAYG